MKPYQLFNSGFKNLMVFTNLYGAEYNLFLFEGVGIKRGRFQKILFSFSPFIYILLLVYSMVYILVKFLLNILLYFFYKKQKLEITGQNIGLVFTNLTVSRIKSAGLYDSISDWIIGPNINCNGHNFNNIIDYKSYLSIGDYFLILKLCICSLLDYCYHFSSLGLLYKNWAFYETYVALAKIARDKRVYYANQSDNWAIMFDNISFKSRTLIQHGYIGEVDVPNKLHKIDHFYALSRKEAENAFQGIFTCRPEVEIMKCTIKLTDYNDINYKILLVLDIRLIEIEKKIIEYLQNDCISIYLKKHPALINDSGYKNLVDKYNLIYITEQIFPKVDYVISYNSTLAYEYISCKIPVYIYTYDNKTYNEGEIITELDRQLKTITTIEK